MAAAALRASRGNWRLLLVVALLFQLAALGGCGSGEHAVAVTPIQFDARGTYRLVFSRISTAVPNGMRSFTRYSSGTLRLQAGTYSLILGTPATFTDSGTFRFGSSVNTILNLRQGSFSVSSTEAPFALTGSYQVHPDYTLVLAYETYLRADLSSVSRVETWHKMSDAPDSRE
jgi:hypothetical protein